MTINITSLYFSETPEKDQYITYDQQNKKRPSWIRFKKKPVKLSFIKINLQGENFWYRSYFENYFFPLLTTPEDYESYYDEIATKYESFVPQNREIGDFVRDVLKKRQVVNEAKILEICAGTGLVSSQVVKSGYGDYTLLDCSEKCLDIAKKKPELKSCKFIKENLLTFNTKDKFDVIISSLCLDLDYFNYTDMIYLLGNLHNALKEGGLFICVDRHIYDVHKKFFEIVETSSFLLETDRGNERYEYFIGKSN